MKTRLIYLVLLIVCFSCGTNNKPLSDAQKEKIKGEVKEVVNKIIKGCEETNYEMVIEPYFDSPDFVFIYNGTALSYKEIADLTKTQFNTFLNQKITIINEKCSILDNSTVLYTINDKCLMNYKDGHSSLGDPETMLFMFKKIDNKWRVIYSVDSYVEKIVKYKEPSKELNQVELMKHWVGTWKGNMGKDTILICECKPFNKGFELYLKNEVKGKTVIDWKTLVGYDKKSDKLIEALIFGDNPEMMLYSMWFSSPNKCEEIFLEDSALAEEAINKWTFEFKTPDELIWNEIVNNKIIHTYNLHRVK
jgi:hypothetical protein